MSELTADDPGRQVGEQGPVTVTRSEERLRVGTRVRATERVVLTKYVVTEEVTRTFTVRREEVRVEHLPLAEEAPAGGVPGRLDEETRELVLYREEPVVQMRLVPVERVRFGKQVVGEERQISAELAREEFDVDER